MFGAWHRRNDEWTRHDLSTPCELDGDEVRPIERFDADALASKVLLYPRLGSDGRMACVLLAPRDLQVRVNDVWLTTGVRVLADRDAIGRPGAGDVYFSTETLPRVEPFPAAQAGAPAVYCARCRAEIVPGQPAVRCGACATWHHENPSDGCNCWTYAPHCAVCDQKTDLDSAVFRWSPAAL